MSLSSVSPTPSRTLRLKDKAIRRDIAVLARFVRFYCRDLHSDRDLAAVTAMGMLAPYVGGLSLKLCAGCRGMFLHGAAKRALCPYDPKPRCKKCAAPCYRAGHREAMRAVMRHSGRRMILRGRLDLLYKYLF